MNIRCWTLSLCITSFFLAAGQADAGDISSDISRGQFIGEGGYFEIGAHLLAGRSAVVGIPKDGDTFTGGAVSIAGRWQKGPGFIEINPFDNINLGLNLWHNQQWWVDALISQHHGSFDPQDIDALKNSNLRKRSADLPIGFRATGYLGNTLIQITVLSSDLRDNHDGYSLSAELGQTWQHRNANLHWRTGAFYNSEDVTDYYFGVTTAQADANFPVYRADDSLRLFAELGLTLALTEHWVFRTHARYAHLSSAMENSPFIDDDYTTLAALTLSYVF